MNHYVRTSRPSGNTRAFVASLLSYILLTSQFAPAAMAFKSYGNRVVRKTIEQKHANGSTALNLIGAPNLTVTKVDSYPSSPNPALPGEVITYDITITNTGTAAATNVTLNDTVDPNTTIIGGSTNASPIAFNDAYSVLGNVRIQVPDGASDLLANDIDPDTGNNTGLTASGPTTTTQGGDLTINADGSFSYNPPPGFTGTDTFTYTVTDSTGRTSTATAILTVTGLIWFVNSAAAAGGDGRLTAPFNCYTGANSGAQTCFSATASDNPGDNIFLFAGAYSGGNVLLNSQKLVGQGASDSLVNITGVTVPSFSDPLPATAGPSPLITTAIAGTDAIPVGQNNILRGFTVGNTTGAKISGNNFATLTVGNSVAPDVTLNGSGQALNLANGLFVPTSAFNGVTTLSSPLQGINLAGITGGVSFGGTAVSNSTTQGILIGTTTAAIDFGNTSVSGGTDGVSLQNNSSGTRTFGTLMVSGGSGSAFLHGAGGGNVTVNGAANLSSGADVIDVQNANPGTLLSFAATTVTKSTSGGSGMNWSANNGSTITFNSLNLSTTNGSGQTTGISASGGGTINVISPVGSQVNATRGPAIIANGITLVANFSSVSSDLSTTNGVSLSSVTGTSSFGNGSITNDSGTSLLVNAGNATINYGVNITQNNAQRAVDIQNTTGGTINLSSGGGNITCGSVSTGILLNNDNGNVTFNTLNLGTNVSRMINQAVTITGGNGTYDLGTVNIFTNNNSGIVATNANGALNSSSGTVDSSNATAIGIDGPGGLTTLGMSLTRVDSNGGAGNGIIIQDTDGTFTITGAGGSCVSSATCTGGTISNKSGANGSATQGTGIFLNNATGISVDRMQLNDFQNYAIRGTTVTGFSLTNSNINGANGNNNAGGSEEDCIRFDNLFTSGTFPTAQISNSAISGGFSENVRINQTLGTLNRLMVSNNTFGLINAASGNDNFDFTATGNGTVANVSLVSNFFNGTRGDFIDIIANGNSTIDSIVRQNKFTNGQAIIPGGGTGVSIRGDSLGTAATVTFDISCNRLVDGYDTVGMFVAKGNGGGSFIGTIVNNIIGPAVAASNADGLFVRSAGTNLMNVLIQNNTISGYTSAGIHLQNNDGSMTMNATVFGNVTSSPGGFAFAGLFIDNGALATDTTQLNVVVGSAGIAAQKNDFSTGDPADFSDVSINNNFATTTLRLSRNGSAGGTATQVLLDDNSNPATTTVSEAGTITLVNTLPAVPATPAGCSIPAAPETIDSSERVAAERVTSGSPQIFVPLFTPPSVNKAATPSSKLRGAEVRETTQVLAKRTRGAVVGRATRVAPPQPEANPNPPVIVGDNITWNVGTLPAGSSVTITFQVQIDNPYNGGPNVSNQGTVTADGGISVLTDDPAFPGATDPTLTPVAAPINVSVADGKVPEPPSGTSSMLFTVVLSSPAPGPISVNFATADQPAGPGHAVAGLDYTATSGTVNFALGQQVQTISVPVLADADNTEPDETFLVNLSAPSGAAILDGQAVGTITAANPPGTLIISELRTFGPGPANDPNDDFVEVYNNTDNPITTPASGYGLFKLSTDCNATPVLVGTIAAGTVIPARGHFLFTGSAYSLANYGGANAAAGDGSLNSDIENNSNVGLFSTTDPLSVSSTNRLDAIGFGAQTSNNCALLEEGNTAPPLTTNLTTLGQHSFIRDSCGKGGSVSIMGLCPTGGGLKDSNDNATDFLFIDTNGVSAGAGQRLGAPGPQNLTSHIQRDATLPDALLDATQAQSSPPNRVRDLTSDPPNNSTFGTLSIRRRFTNNTGAPVTQLRFRVVDVSTFPTPAGIADLRLRTSGSVVVTVNDAATCASTGTPATPPCTVTVQGTTLEEPPLQPNGGGFNSTVMAGTITVGTPLANGASIDLQFLLGVQQTGNFKVYVIVEALP